MSTASPSRPSSSPSLAVIGVAAAIVAVVIVAVLAWLISGGYFSAFGHWMHTSDVGTALRYLLESLMLLVCVLLSTAALIYIQRKIWGAVQLRRGPNVVGPWGVLQPFADFFKFILKEPIIPASAN
ncbi:MAG: NADH-quinone oxidoreductase subunit H, partial [Roseiarcus sp.]